MIYYQWSFGNWAGRSGQRWLELHATTMSCLPGSKTEFSFNQPGEEMRCNTRDTGRKGCSTVEETFKSENCPCPLHNILDEPLKIFNLLISCTVPFQRNIVELDKKKQCFENLFMWHSGPHFIIVTVLQSDTCCEITYTRKENGILSPEPSAEYKWVLPPEF